MRNSNGPSRGMKKWIITICVVVLAAAIGCGIWYYLGHNSSEPVYVYPFHYVGMTEYWGDNQESYGPVTTDKIQTVYLSDTQTVTEVLVQVGDTVKKGDILMSFDTTLSDLALERKRLDVEKLKLQLENARKELQRINGMKPMVIPDFTEEPEEEDVDLGPAVSPGNPQIGENAAYDGSTPEMAILCWINSSDSIGDAVLEQVRQKAEQLWNENEEAKYNTPAEGEEEKPPYQQQTMEKFYVVFKVTEGNRQLGQKLLWQGLEVTAKDGTFGFRFCDAMIPDYTVAESDQEEIAPEWDFGSGFTAAQIAQMRLEQEKKIKDLEFQVKMAEANYKIAQTEAGDGNIYAQIDGEVVSLLSEEEAKMQMQPILKVSGGGGFYVEGFVSELEKDAMQLGMEVTVNDWNTGMMYTGTVTSLGDFPSSEAYWSGMGNPNASYYPFLVFVDGSADLQAGRYVSVTYSTSAGENGIYLQKPFLRTENGKSFVFVLGEDGRLEKRFVTTGKDLYGSYTEILGGLTAEDLVAFPYGKNVKDGAAAVEGDMSNLYG